MNKILKFILIYLVTFVCYFSILAFAAMDENHGFFYLNSVKITIRIFFPLLLSVNIFIFTEQIKKTNENSKKK